MSEALAVGIVVAHGAMAQGMVGAVSRIAGDQTMALIPVSNEGKSTESLCAELEEMITESGDTPILLFTDMQSGSCAFSALRSRGEGSLRAVITGVNLPILLDFVFHRDMPLDELVERLLAKGRGAVQAR